ncbi:MAG: hypothetical protein ACI3XX_05210 [Eubacteriales bacterium]
MKIKQKIGAILLSCLMLGAEASNALFVVPADKTKEDIVKTVPVLSNESVISGKEEVIYVNLDGNGNIKDVYVVNIFGGGNIEDYGNYDWVKILNTSDKISQIGDKIVFSSSADRVYYEGKLSETELPWNISIRYFIDGTEYSAADIGGKSGKLEIKFVVEKNENCKGNFFESFALQTSFTLNTEKCKNIVASGATVANVGKNKQISYTILPGKGIDTVITADVSDFEMGSVALNGVPLSLDIDVDESELTDKLNDMQSAVGEANDGAGELQEGLDEIAANTPDLTDGANDMKNGLSEICENNNDLVNGAFEAYKGLCEAAQAILNNKLAESGLERVELTVETYEAVLADVIAQLDETAVRERATELAHEYVTAEVERNEEALYLGFLKTQEDEIYAQYVTMNADSICFEYVKSIESQVLSQYLKSVEDEIYSGYVKSIENDIYYEYVKSIEDSVYAQYLKSNEYTVYVQYVKSVENDSYAQYVKSNEDAIYYSYVEITYGETLYRQVAEEKAYQQLLAGGSYDEASAREYLESSEGQAMVTEIVAGMSDGDKEQIINTAVSSLTDEEKEQILAGTQEGLTESEKKQILAVAVANLTDAQKEEILAGAKASLTDTQKVHILAGAVATLTDEQKTQILEGAVSSLTDEQKAQILEGAKENLTDEQKTQILEGAKDSLTDEEKEQICGGALASLTDEQKQMIIDGALSELTDEQKTQIREAYIEEQMQSDEVRAKIEDAVNEAGNAKVEIGSLKGKLDDFGELYDGVVDYTNGVSEASDGAESLYDGIVDYTNGVSEAADGAKELKDGLQEFYDELDGIDTEISDKIQELLDDMTGSNYELYSFVSEKNVNVNNVQFVISTEAIKAPEMPQENITVKEETNFWKKLLKLFGID